jgi:predicted transposase/invertase (TIGR01784 family)
MITKPLPLIDVNQLSDTALKKQQWVGPMALAMKYIREANLNPYAADILTSIRWKPVSAEDSALIDLLLKYFLAGGNIHNITDFIKQISERLSRPVRSAVMTAAEQLEAIGLEKGRKENTAEIALKMLKEGSDFAFISKITGLSPKEIERLRS